MQANGPKSKRVRVERRQSDRMPCSHCVFWRSAADEQRRRDLLVSVSETGFALVTAHEHAPAPGSRIACGCRPQRGALERPAIVTRVEQLSPALDLVAAERVRQDETLSPPADPTPVADICRRCRERRRSQRWETRKVLRWRVGGGRRIRESRLVERSLDGLVLVTRGGDMPRIGARIVPEDRSTADRFGFRSAVVRRTLATSWRERLVFAEIEA